LRTKIAKLLILLKMIIFNILLILRLITKFDLLFKVDKKNHYHSEMIFVE